MAGEFNWDGDSDHLSASRYHHDTPPYAGGGSWQSQQYGHERYGHHQPYSYQRSHHYDSMYGGAHHYHERYGLLSRLLELTLHDLAACIGLTVLMMFFIFCLISGLCKYIAHFSPLSTARFSPGVAIVTLPTRGFQKC